MNNTIVQIILTLISIIATLVGGTGTTIGLKNKSKNKSLERKLEELKTNQNNQKEINIEIKKELRNLNYKIDDIKNILINNKNSDKL